VDKEIKKMRKLVDFMRKQGVLTLKTSEMELSLSPIAMFPVEHSEEHNSDSNKIHPSLKPISELDLALWSSPGYIPEVSDAHHNS
jgi:hypothetical protein